MTRVAVPLLACAALIAVASASDNVLSSQEACAAFHESSATITNRALPSDVWTSAK